MIKAIIEVQLRKRNADKWGQGYFNAPRDGGKRSHSGIDYYCESGAVILSPIAGKVTKLGYPYGDDLSFRYVEVTDKEHARHRLFYVEPSVEVGDKIEEGDQIGYSQDLTTRYNTPEKGPMPNHVHYEIMVGKTHVDPEEYKLS
jgi:murein DD-endopeptidase MepM/ murein hydrolase activator NlpD